MKQNEQTQNEANQNINSSVDKQEQQDRSNRSDENDAAQNSKKDEDANPVYTNSEAPQQQIERDSKGVMAKGTKDDPSAVYNTDNSTLQSKEEKQHDESVHPNKNDRVEIPDLPETEIDRSISSERGQHEEKNP